MEMNELTDTGNNMDEPQNHYMDRQKPNIKNAYCVTPFIKNFFKCKLI